MSEEQKQRLRATVLSMRHCFAYSMADLTGYTGPLGPASIEMLTDKPVWEPPRSLAPKETEILEGRFVELAAASIVAECPTTNKYASNHTIAPQKDPVTGLWTGSRCCGDYRRINANSVPDHYGIPTPEWG